MESCGYHNLSNLININGITQGLEIKVESAVMEPDIFEKEILFEKPFKNKCFGVLCMDDASIGYHIEPVIVVTDSSSISKSGFTAISQTNTNVYLFSYVAFGY